MWNEAAHLYPFVGQLMAKLRARTNLSCQTSRVRPYPFVEPKLCPWALRTAGVSDGFTGPVCLTYDFEIVMMQTPTFSHHHHHHQQQQHQHPHHQHHKRHHRSHITSPQCSSTCLMCSYCCGPFGSHCPHSFQSNRKSRLRVLMEGRPLPAPVHAILSPGFATRFAKLYISMVLFVFFFGFLHVLWFA